MPLTLEEFTFGFVNTFTSDAAAEGWVRALRGSRDGADLFYEAGFANFICTATEVHFKNADRASLLIIGAEKDNTVPASLAKKQFEKYEKSQAQTDYLEFPGRPHLMMAADGWQEIAGQVEDWISGVLSASPTAGRTTSA